MYVVVLAVRGHCLVNYHLVVLVMREQYLVDNHVVVVCFAQARSWLLGEGERGNPGEGLMQKWRT